MQRYLLAIGYIGIASCGAGTAAGNRGGSPAPAAAPAAAKDAVQEVSAAGRGPAIRYQPIANAAYTMHRIDSLIVHLPGGATQRQSLERTAYLRLTLIPSDASGYRATVVLDSLHAAASAIPMPAESLASVRGTRWTTTVGTDGQLGNLVANRSTMLGDQFANHLRLLFPPLPAGGVKAGAEWTDSTSFPLRADAFDATEHARTAYRAVADRQGIKIESRGTYRRAGTGMRVNDRLEMVAAGKREGTYYLSPDGRLLSARGSDTGAMTITVPSVGQKVPVDQTGRYEIRPTSR